MVQTKIAPSKPFDLALTESLQPGEPEYHGGEIFHRDALRRKASPHGLVPREAIQWSTDEDTQDSGWKLCPGPVGQQVENIGGIDEEEGKEEDEYGYQGASRTAAPLAPRSTTEASGSELGLEEEQKTSGNFIFKAALAAVALCLGGVLCLRFRRRSAGREEYGTRYGRSYVMDNL